MQDNERLVRDVKRLDKELDETRDRSRTYEVALPLILILQHTSAMLRAV